MKKEMGQMVSEVFEEVQKGKKTSEAWDIVVKKYQLNEQQAQVLLSEFEEQEIENTIAQM